MKLIKQSWQVVVFGLVVAMFSMLVLPAGTAFAAKPEFITMWTRLEAEVDLLRQYGEAWAKETGVKVRVYQEGPEVQQLAQATRRADGPDVIYGVPNDQLAGFVEAGLVQEIPEAVFSNDDYVGSAVQACFVGGKRYGLPIAVETIGLFYNTDKITTPPKTWDELIEAAKANGGLTFEATSIYYDLGFFRAFDSYIFNYQDGAYDVGDIGLGNENAVKAYAYLSDLAQVHGFVSADMSTDIARSMFQNGESAFYIGGPWDTAGFNAVEVPFAVSPLPTLNGREFVTPVGTQLGFVSSKSQKQEYAWDFVKYLMENSAEEMYKVGGRIPASLVGQQNIDFDANTEAFTAQIANGEPLPGVAEIGHLWGIFEDNMKLLFRGVISPEEAGKYISSQLEESIELMHSGR